MINPKAKTATAIFLLFLTILTATAVTYAAGGFNFNQTATINLTGTVTYTLGGIPFSSGSAIDWGVFIAGQTKQFALNVNNTQNIAITPILTSTLPTGWTQTWSLNNVEILPNTAQDGILTLTAPADATAGTITITSNLAP
jgi:uncharacterized membrane protein